MSNYISINKLRLSKNKDAFLCHDAVTLSVYDHEVVEEDSRCFHLPPGVQCSVTTNFEHYISIVYDCSNGGSGGSGGSPFSGPTVSGSGGSGGDGPSRPDEIFDDCIGQLGVATIRDVVAAEEYHSRCGCDPSALRTITTEDMANIIAINEEVAINECKKDICKFLLYPMLEARFNEIIIPCSSETIDYKELFRRASLITNSCRPSVTDMWDVLDDISEGVFVVNSDFGYSTETHIGTGLIPQIEQLTEQGCIDIDDLYRDLDADQLCELINMEPGENIGQEAGLEYLSAKLDEDQFFFYGGEDCIKDRPQFQAWHDLVTFLPPSNFDELLPDNTSLAPFGTDIPWATINLDYFYVELCDLPEDLVPSELYSILRSVFSEELDLECNSDFELYPDYTNDQWVNNPVGVPFQIDIAGPNNGDVITTFEYNLDENAAVYYDGYHWIFTTIKGGINSDHPVSGNRKFGIFKSSDNCWTFYTLGTDRLFPSKLGVGIQGAIAELIGFASADALWSCVMENVGEYAESLEITVGSMGSETCRPDIASFLEAWKRSCYEFGMLDDEFKECLECD